MNGVLGMIFRAQIPYPNTPPIYFNQKNFPFNQKYLHFCCRKLSAWQDPMIGGTWSFLCSVELGWSWGFACLLVSEADSLSRTGGEGSDVVYACFFFFFGGVWFLVDNSREWLKWGSYILGWYQIWLGTFYGNVLEEFSVRWVHFLRVGPGLVS